MVELTARCDSFGAFEATQATVGTEDPVSIVSDSMTSARWRKRTDQRDVRIAGRREAAARKVASAEASSRDTDRVDGKEDAPLRAGGKSGEVSTRTGSQARTISTHSDETDAVDQDNKETTRLQAVRERRQEQHWEGMEISVCCGWTAGGFRDSLQPRAVA